MRDKRLKAYDLFPTAPSVSITQLWMSCQTQSQCTWPTYLLSQVSLSSSTVGGMAAAKLAKGVRACCIIPYWLANLTWDYCYPIWSLAVYEIQTRQFQPRRHSCSDQSSIYCAVDGTMTMATPFALLTSVLMYG